jgi:multicomponent Na+:H+ antiporter subunit D
MDLIPLLLPIFLATAAVLAVLIGEWHPRAPRLIAVAATAVTLVLAVGGLVAVLRDGALGHELGCWVAPLGVEYRLDALSGFVAVVVGVIGLAVAVYPARAGFGPRAGREGPLFGLVLLLLAGQMGVLVSGDLFHLFVALEIYAISTYALVSLGGQRATFASLRYLIFGTIGSGFYLLGVGFLYFMTGSLNMADVAERLPPLGDNPTVVAGLGLIVIGLGLKMALFPLHVWLPEAHSYAPPAVAALLAAVQVKIAAYALVRILFDVVGVEFVTVTVPVTELLAWFGAAGVLFGSAMAIVQRDFKRMLAYSTVAQLGYIGIGIGLATPMALAAALLHVLNHALMKCCLFLVAGAVKDSTGITRISGFAGLAGRMPLTAAGFTIAALSMVGVPPLGGFFSKWYLLLGSLDEGRVVFVAVIAVSSLMTLAYFLRVFESVYSRGKAEPAMAGASEPGLAMVGPVLLLAAGIVGVGLANALIFNEVLDPIAVAMLGAVAGT